MRRAAAAVGLLVLLLAGAAAADPSPSPTPEPENPLTVTVTSLLPRAPRAGQAFEVRGTVRNVGSQPADGVRVRLGLGEVIVTRGALHDAERDGADITSHFSSRAVTSDPQGRLVLPRLEPGATAHFDLRTDVETLRLHRTGVYPIDVEARGSVDGSGTQLLGAVPTWVPFFSEQPLQNKVAVLLPLVDKPHQAPDGSFLDDQLATELRAGGLRHLLSAGGAAAQAACGTGAVGANGKRDPAPTRCAPVPVTYAVDPDLVSAAAVMADSSHYYVGSGRQRSRGTGKDAAAAWLEQLRQQLAVPTGSVLALPYGDPDVDALAASAQGREDVRLATTLGNSVVTTTLHSTPVDVLYPPTQISGTVTPQALDVLAPPSGQPFAYVLDESAFPDSEDQDRSPSAPVALGPSPTASSLHGLVADGVLSADVLGSTARDEGPRLAEQRFIAETAIVAAEAPGLSRTFVIAPDRYSDASPTAAAEALRDIGRLPWLCPVALDAAAQGKDSCPTPRTLLEQGQHPDQDGARSTLSSSTDGRLPAPYLAAVARQAGAATQLTTSVLDGGTSSTTVGRIGELQVRLRKAVARAQSAAWRGDPTGRDQQLALLTAEVGRLVGDVDVLGGKLLLTSSRGTLQVSLENKLDLPVRVRLRFTFPTGKVVSTGLVSVAAKRSVPVSVRADTQRSGQFLVFVQVYDRSDGGGAAFGKRPSAQIQVRSTRYGRLALGVTFAAAAVLFIAAGIRVLRRATRRRRGEPGDEATA